MKTVTVLAPSTATVCPVGPMIVTVFARCSGSCVAKDPRVIVCAPAGKFAPNCTVAGESPATAAIASRSVQSLFVGVRQSLTGVGSSSIMPT